MRDKNGFRVDHREKVQVDVQKDGCTVRNNRSHKGNGIFREKDYETKEINTSDKNKNKINNLKKKNLNKKDLTRNQKTILLKPQTSHGTVDEQTPICNTQDNDTSEYHNNEQSEFHEDYNDKKSKPKTVKNILKFLNLPHFRRRKSNELSQNFEQLDEAEEPPHNFHSYPHHMYSLFTMRRYSSDLQVNEGDWKGYLFCNCWTSLTCVGTYLQRAYYSTNIHSNCFNLLYSKNSQAKHTH